MSNFVSRVAARAVGRAAVARPRLPALFEPSAAAAGLEVVEEVVVRRPGPVVPPATAAPSPRPHASPPASGDLPTHRRARPAEAPARTTGARKRPSSAVRRDGTPAVTRPRDESSREAIVERMVAEDATVLAAAAAPAGTVAAAPAALPTQPALLEPQPPRSAPASPPVHVHIGRLEVRANLQEPPRPQRAAEPPRPQELSLGDYLHGRRSAS